MTSCNTSIYAKPSDSKGIRWHLPFEAPMKVVGFHWLKENRVYDRLPINGRPETMLQFPMGVKTVVESTSNGALRMATHTAGGQIRFRTDSTFFRLQGKVGNEKKWDHMPLTASESFDLYLKDGQEWHYYGVTRTEHEKGEFSAVLCENLKREMRDVIIHFPLYNSVESVAVGLDDKAVVETPSPFAAPRPIVFYGTSITQGGCASHPGMASSNILSRMLDMEVLNFGFSGCGRGEPEIAGMLAQISNPSLYLIDYCWNVDVKALQATLPTFIDTIRSSHPQVPIMLIAPTPSRFGHPGFAEPDSATLQQQSDIMKNEATLRNTHGDRNFFFFDAYHEALGPEPVDCTVDGIHLTDLGFYRYSIAILPHIRRALCSQTYN